jgi:hypothetical protein
MSQKTEKTDLIDLTHTTTVCYKTRTGEIKELRVVQALDPDQRKLEFKDIQLLAKAITEELKKDG